MAKHKVTTDPSTAYTGTVSFVEVVDSQYGEEYKFTFDDGTEVFEKIAAVERQITGEKAPLHKAGVTDVNQLVGMTLRFSRTPMASDPKKGFLNIDISRSAPQGAPRPVAPAKAAHAAGPLIAELDDFDIVEELRDVAYPSPARNVNEDQEDRELLDAMAEQRALRTSTSKTVRVPDPAPAIDHAARAQAKYGRHLEFVLDQVVPAVLARAPELAFDINAAVATLMIEEAKR